MYFYDILSIDVNMKPLPMIDCCTPLGAPMSAEAAGKMASAMQVLADPARLRALSLITRAGEACVCQLTGPLGLSQPTVSHHLKVLQDAGLLEREKRGRWAFYRPILAPLRELADSLAIAEPERESLGDVGDVLGVISSLKPA